MEGTCTVITGAPGSGKTLGWVRWLVDDFLRKKSSGRIITNVRLNLDIICDYVCTSANTFLSRRFGFVPAYDSLYERFILMNEDDCRSLRETFDVSSWFNARLGGIEDCYICLDEVHTYVATGFSVNYLRSWGNFLAVLRHSHARFCGISQDISQIDRVLKSRVENRIEYVSADALRDPYFRIPIGEWCRLFSACLGRYVRPVCLKNYVRSVNGAWRVSSSESHMLSDRYFGFYDSYQKECL